MPMGRRPPLSRASSAAGRAAGRPVAVAGMLARYASTTTPACRADPARASRNLVVAPTAPATGRWASVRTTAPAADVRTTWAATRPSPVARPVAGGAGAAVANRAAAAAATTAPIAAPRASARAGTARPGGHAT